MTTRSIRVLRGIDVPMPDGTRLAADVHLVDESPRPVLLQRTPYNRENALASLVWGLVEPIAAIDAGFTVVIQDVRGRWGSGGTFTPFRNEAEDGAATIEWVSKQPWCDGRVATYGMSYAGATQLLAAGEAPAALFGVAPVLTSGDYYDGWTYDGGVFSLGFSLLWSLTDLAPDYLAKLQGLSEGERARLNQSVTDALANLPATYDHWPLESVPDIASVAPWYTDWLDHPTRDAYWESISLNHSFGSMTTPALHIGGWYDLFLAGTLNTYKSLRSDAASAYARENQRLVIGPWSHGNLSDAVGDFHFGIGSALASLDLNRLHLDFFRSALEEEDVPGPRVRVFVLGANSWSEEAEWPPPDVTSTTLFLRSGRSEDGSLEADPPVQEAPHSYVYDPADPTPTVGGRTFLPGLLSSLNSGMKEQSALLARADGVLFASAKLDAPLVVMGHVAATLWISTEGTDVDILAKLVDIHPDGTCYNLCEGMQRASLRSDPRVAAAITPNEPFSIEVDLIATANLFAAGHQIGLWIGSASHPHRERSTNSIARDRVGVPARINIWHDADHLSSLELQVRAS